MNRHKSSSQYLLVDAVVYIAYAAALAERFVLCSLQPVANAPGSVLVDPWLPNSLLTRPRAHWVVASIERLYVAGWIWSLQHDLKLTP